MNEHEGRILHVVVNPHVTPKRVVTVFFDRRARNQGWGQPLTMDKTEISRKGDGSIFCN